jgi:hypothetical protein
MKTRVLILITCASLFAAVVFAHGGEVHVIGTVAKVAQDSITVNATENKIVTVTVARETKFVSAKEKARITDLRVGDRVVIHAKQVAEGNLVADIVEFAAGTELQVSRTQTLTGVVSDAACGATHGMKGMTSADCTRMCVKAGRKYALVVGKDVYVLQGHEAEIEKLAGESARVKGSVSGKTMTVESVTPAKKG